jgi:hypothetical protein
MEKEQKHLLFVGQRAIFSKLNRCHVLLWISMQLAVEFCTLSQASQIFLRKGKVRRILYAWGTAEAADLTEASKGIGRLDVAIHIRDPYLPCMR